ncbi:monothiol glutaredoxin grx4 [Tulasnella sp. 331]|nr:monothiol glutaredoxin grx4 [Tulasnella sp. 331]KAG8890743.1 monothiol glutaredoxin grx4 [Tulasnella sp. 332]
MSKDSSTSNYHDVKSVEEFKSLMEADLERVSLLNFWAPLAAPCEQMNQVVKELAKKYDSTQVLSIQAEELEDVAESFDVELVPTFVLLKGHTLLARITGADAATLNDAVAAHSRKAPQALTKTDLPPQAPPKEIPDNAIKAPAAAPEPVAEKQESEEELTERCKKLMEQSKIVLFMKGSPDAPRCGFSRQTVAILREQKVEFTHFDILTDEAVRQALKKINEWPTFPQLIVKGEFHGGLDVLKESIESGEFEELKAGL